ncbi:hypothetical protein Glove_423g85 [Diversispora epigaea]|uniref:Uncharacterized protein n=1 Tax=Diversispora epigaea TaxID=1348612 RepID=A0A397GVD3_9GLOM|nr:hypothetical protein Glove_423g85 [Diversispora epigaea]
MGKIEIPLEAYNENVKQENRNIIKKIAYKAIPKKIEVQWLANRNSQLEICINNYQCSGIWYQDFLTEMNLEGSSTQRLVAYLILQKIIKFTFSTNTEQKNLYSVDPQLISNTIINFELAKASKFSYITGWVIYKLIKSDNIMKSHSKYEFMCIYLKVLSSEKVVYE